MHEYRMCMRLTVQYVFVHIFVRVCVCVYTLGVLYVRQVHICVLVHACKMGCDAFSVPVLFTCRSSLGGRVNTLSLPVALPGLNECMSH